MAQELKKGEELTTVTAGIETVSLKKFIDKSKGYEDDCKLIAENLHKYGLLIVEDPRVAFEENENFIDMMEAYFEQEEDTIKKDARPELHYQRGVTPSGIEHARDHCEMAKKFSDDAKPATICPPEVDPKWRFFWKIGERPDQKDTEYPDLNAEDVVPAAFPQWKEQMNKWGNFLHGTFSTVLRMAAVGFGLEEDELVKLTKGGPHLLAPTASDLNRFGKLGTVFASLHYDLNLMTAHGKSRYPGLYVWTRDGKRLRVIVPKGCILLQAGKQFEWLTGGHVLAGFHEVVVAPVTVLAIEEAKKNKKSLWRISSTLFGHVASDNTLEPLGHFRSKEALAKFPPVKAGKQVSDELAAIKLKQDA